MHREYERGKLSGHRRISSEPLFLHLPKHLLLTLIVDHDRVGRFTCRSNTKEHSVSKRKGEDSLALLVFVVY